MYYGKSALQIFSQIEVSLEYYLQFDDFYLNYIEMHFSKLADQYGNSLPEVLKNNIKTFIQFKEIQSSAEEEYQDEILDDIDEDYKKAS